MGICSQFIYSADQKYPIIRTSFRKKIFIVHNIMKLNDLLENTKLLPI